MSDGYEIIIGKLDNLTPGEAVVYATWTGDTKDPLPSQIMKRAWELYESGRVCLTQRANGPPFTKRSIDYIATGRAPPFRPVAAANDDRRWLKREVA